MRLTHGGRYKITAWYCQAHEEEYSKHGLDEHTTYRDGAYEYCMRCGDPSDATRPLYRCDHSGCQEVGHARCLGHSAHKHSTSTRVYCLEHAGLYGRARLHAALGSTPSTSGCAITATQGATLLEDHVTAMWDLIKKKMTPPTSCKHPNAYYMLVALSRDQAAPPLRSKHALTALLQYLSGQGLTTMEQLEHIAGVGHQHPPQPQPQLPDQPLVQQAHLGNHAAMPGSSPPPPDTQMDLPGPPQPVPGSPAEALVPIQPQPHQVNQPQAQQPHQDTSAVAPGSLPPPGTQANSMDLSQPALDGPGEPLTFPQPHPQQVGQPPVRRPMLNGPAATSNSPPPPASQVVTGDHQQPRLGGPADAPDSPQSPPAGHASATGPTPLPPRAAATHHLPHAPQAVQALRLTVWNVMGLGTTRADLLRTITERDPHVFILTETKLQDRPGGKVRQALGDATEGYTTFRSNSAGRGRQAGVLMAVRTSLAATCAATRLAIPAVLQGHLVHILLDFPGSRKAHILGVYVPTCGNHAKATTEKLSDHIATVAAKAAARGEQVVVGGDLNSDFSRAKASTMWALALAQRLGDIGFEEAHTGPPVADGDHTYIGHSASTFIDNVLIYAPAPTPLAKHWATECRLTHSTSDHAALTVELDCAALGWSVPHPPAPTNDAPVETEPRFVTPIAKSQLTRLRQRVALELGSEISGLLNDIKAHPRHGGTGSKASRKQAVNGLADRLQKILDKVMDIARQELDQVPAKLGRWLPKVAGKALRAWVAFRKQLQTMLSIHRSSHGAADHPGLEKITDPRVPTSPEEGEGRAEFAKRLTDMAGETRKEIRTLLRDRDSASYKKNMQRFQASYATNAKRCHRQVFRDEETRNKVEAIHHPVKGLVTGGQDIADAFTLDMTALMTPSLSKTCTYKKEQVPGPWSSDYKGGTIGPDPFVLRTPRGSPGFETDMRHKLTRTLFQNCLAGLSNKKAPGPDGIPNEILKHLPDELQDTMFELMAMMWRCK